MDNFNVQDTVAAALRIVADASQAAMMERIDECFFEISRRFPHLAYFLVSAFLVQLIDRTSEHH